MTGNLEADSAFAISAALTDFQRLSDLLKTQRQQTSLNEALSAAPIRGRLCHRLLVG